VGNKRHDCTSLRRAICVCGGPALRLHYTSTAKGSHAVDEQTTAVGDDERLHATSSLVFLDSCDKLGENQNHAAPKLLRFNLPPCSVCKYTRVKCHPSIARVVSLTCFVSPELTGESWMAGGHSTTCQLRRSVILTGGPGPVRTTLHRR
jgi:hypothetical protein